LGSIIQGIQSLEKITWEEAQFKAEHCSRDEIKTILSGNKMAFATIFLHNLKDNIDSNPTFLSYPIGFENPLFVQYMTKVNHYYYKIHAFFFILVLLCFYLAFRNKEKNVLILTGVTAVIGYYILLTSSISAFQGDRLVLPALPVFILLYILMLRYLIIRSRNFFIW